jgi:hypothetical protein
MVYGHYPLGNSINIGIFILLFPHGDRLRAIFIIPVDRRWYIIQLVIAIGHIY